MGENRSGTSPCVCQGGWHRSRQALLLSASLQLTPPQEFSSFHFVFMCVGFCLHVHIYHL